MLILIPKWLGFFIQISENLQTQWDELNGPPRIPFYFTFNPLGH
jgi:hypothetical protein